MRGLFLTIEGIEGSGKTTQALEIAAWADRTGIPLLASKEPGKVFGGAVRQILLDNTEEIDPVAETLLFLADRAQHISAVVRPALRGGSWVLLDRFSDSTLVYQGFVREAMPIPTVIDLNKLATAGLQPDLTILLDVEPKAAMKRVAKRADQQKRMLTGRDLEHVSFVRDAFLEVARAHADRFIMVDANQTETKVRKQIIELLEPLGEHWKQSQ